MPPGEAGLLCLEFGLCVCENSMSLFPKSTVQMERGRKGVTSQWRNCTSTTRRPRPSVTNHVDTMDAKYVTNVALYLSEIPLSFAVNLKCSKKINPINEKKIDELTIRATPQGPH